MLISAFISGGGQLFVCKQKLKSIFFFTIPLVYLAIELFSGYWIEYLTGAITNFELRLHGGYFSKGIWGLITLGDNPGVRMGDHSTLLMINGIISLILLFILLSVYVWNLKDAYSSGKFIDENNRYKSSKEYLKEFYDKSFEYVVLLPIGLLVLFITIMPIIFSIMTAFTNYDINHLPPGNLVDWVGFENLKKLITNPAWSGTFFSVLGWTIIWAVVATISTFTLGLIQALILSSPKVKIGNRIFKTIFILPWAIPAMISLLVFRNIFNGQFGPMNEFLLNAGLISERIPFLTDPILSKLTVIGVNLWLGFPMFMLIILGNLSNMDKSILEAASIDGANKMQELIRIKLPILLKATLAPLIMSMVANFNGFGAIYFLTEGGPANPNFQFAGNTDILISWIYKLTLNNQMYSMAAVMSVLIFIFVGTISIIQVTKSSTFKED